MKKVLFLAVLFFGFQLEAAKLPEKFSNETVKNLKIKAMLGGLGTCGSFAFLFNEVHTFIKLARVARNDVGLNLVLSEFTHERYLKSFIGGASAIILSGGFTLHSLWLLRRAQRERRKNF